MRLLLRPSVSISCYNSISLFASQSPKYCSCELEGTTRRSIRIWQSQQSSTLAHNLRRLGRAPLCSAENGENGTYKASDADCSSTDHRGSTGKSGQGDREWLSSTEILKKLKRYGVSGILSYGLLNTAYYLTAFLLVWLYIAPAPGKMGFRAAAERFLKMMAMVWAGSQVTKLIRAGGALALAPFVDRGLSWFTIKFKFQSRGKAFLAIVCFCLGLVILLFLAVTLLSA